MKLWLPEGKEGRGINWETEIDGYTHTHTHIYMYIIDM